MNKFVKANKTKTKINNKTVNNHHNNLPQVNVKNEF